MPLFNVNLRRMKPGGSSNTPTVQHGTLQVEADTIQHAREIASEKMGTDKAGDVTWTDQGTADRSGDGLGWIEDIQLDTRSAKGSATGAVNQRSRSPITRGTAAEDPPTPLVKRPRHAKPLPGPADQPDDARSDESLANQGLTDRPGAVAETGTDASLADDEDHDPANHPDDTDAWKAQQARNAAAAHP